jgi:hypothetical protein
MDILKLIDSSFSHSILGYCSDFQTSLNFKWERTNIDFKTDVVVYTDQRLHEYKEKDKSIAWLIEPTEIDGQSYNFVIKNKDKFKTIFTYEKQLLDMGEPFEFYPFGGCWIQPEKQKIYKKNKNISIIASSKNFTSGHKLRHEVISKYSQFIDVFGRGYSPIEYKIDGLQDYRFSIVIENCKRDYWFTEKLIDCLRTGTIPIYWGCPSIGDFFNTNGFIIFNEIEELGSILPKINEELYNTKLEFIEENFNLSLDYIIPDEIIYQKIKKNERN